MCPKACLILPLCWVEGVKEREGGREGGRKGEREGGREEGREGG